MADSGKQDVLVGGDYRPTDDPNCRQVGGGHYGLSEYQHWDLVWDNKLGYFEGQITKYVARWRKKAGVQDLEKALHYCEKFISLQKRYAPDFRRVPRDPVHLERFLAANELAGRLEALIFHIALAYEDLNDLQTMRGYIALLVSQAKKSTP